MMSPLHSLLEKFSAFSLKYPGPIPDSVTFSTSANEQLPHIVFTGLIHGNEVGSLAAFLKMITYLAEKKILFPGKVSFVLGNRAAALQDKRFVERDLNRSFGNIENKAKETLEGRRAQEILLLLQDCSLLVDFHQTIQPTRFPFYTFAFHRESYLWARALGGTEKFLTREAKSSFSALGQCIDEYVQQTLKKPALTIELSQKGFFAEAESLVFFLLKNTLKKAQAIFFQRHSLEKMALKNSPLSFYESYFRYPFAHPQEHLLEEYVNFQKLSAGENFIANAKGENICAQKDSFVFFPKYPPRDVAGNALGVLPGELVVLAQQIDPQTRRYLKQHKDIL